MVDHSHPPRVPPLLPSPGPSGGISPAPPPAQLPHRSAPGLPRALRVRHTHKRAAVSDQVTLEVTAATPLPWNLKPREPSLPEATSQ